MSQLLQFTGQLKPFGDLPPQDPILPSSVQFFSYCQNAAQSFFQKDFLPLMLEQLIDKPAKPNAFLAECRTSPGCFFHTVMWLLEQDFYCTTLVSFMENFIIPIVNRLPQELLILVQPFMQPSPSAGTTPIVPQGTSNAPATAPPYVPPSSQAAGPLPPSTRIGSVAGFEQPGAGVSGPLAPTPPSPAASGTPGASNPQPPLQFGTLPSPTASLPQGSPSSAGGPSSDGFGRLMATFGDLPSKEATPTSSLVGTPSGLPLQGQPSTQAAPAAPPHALSPTVGYATTSTWDALQATQAVVLSPQQIDALRKAGLYPPEKDFVPQVSVPLQRNTNRASFAFPFVPQSYSFGVPGSLVSSQPPLSSGTGNMMPSPPSFSLSLFSPQPSASPFTYPQCTFIHTRDPPTFNGLLDDTKIPDLFVWYRRVETHAENLRQHIRDVLDRCTEGMANVFIQQLFLQNITSPTDIKRLFFTQYSHLIHRDTEKAFHDLLFGSGVKMGKGEHAESYISNFRMALFKADIKEHELTPNSSMVRTLVEVFNKGLPEGLAKDLRFTKDGNEFSTMQELYEAAVLAGKKYLKRKGPSADSSSPSKKNKSDKQTKSQPVPSKPKPSHSSKRPFSQDKPKTKQNQAPSKATGGKKPPLLQRALATLSRVTTREPQHQGPLAPLAKDVPPWPEPFPETNNEPLDPSLLNYDVVKSVVGSARMNKARDSKPKACVFCALPLPSNKPHLEHIAECKHRPDDF